MSEDPAAGAGAALDPPRAWGGPAGRGRVRAAPEDFRVEELLGFAPDGAGSHWLLKVRKRAANTTWVAGEPARACGCRNADVGYAGMKDRHAVAVQWFSVPRPRTALDPMQLGSPEAGFEVLEAQPHGRKLPRGALAGNRFVLRVREFAGDRELLGERLEALRAGGVPNYFGEQRFGRGGANLVEGEPATRVGRGMQLSAARSLIFNAVLAERVRAGSWNRLLEGDVANLEGRGSVFRVDGSDPTLAERCARLALHPTGPLWGRGESLATGSIRALEEHIAALHAREAGQVLAAGMEAQRRSLRLVVHELGFSWSEGMLELGFRLGRGGYATVVLRELLEISGGSAAA